MLRGNKTNRTAVFGFEWHDATYCPEARHHNLHSALRLLHHQRRRLLRCHSMQVAPLQVTPDDLENVAVLLVFVDPASPAALDGLERLQEVTGGAGVHLSAPHHTLHSQDVADLRRGLKSQPLCMRHDKEFSKHAVNQCVNC